MFSDPGWITLLIGSLASGAICALLATRLKNRRGQLDRGSVIGLTIAGAAMGIVVIPVLIVLNLLRAKQCD